MRGINVVIKFEERNQEFNAFGPLKDLYVDKEEDDDNDDEMLNEL